MPCNFYLELTFQGKSTWRLQTSVKERDSQNSYNWQW